MDAFRAKNTIAAGGGNTGAILQSFWGKDEGRGHSRTTYKMEKNLSDAG